MGDMGEVDLFGLNDFGQAEGMNPLWGSMIGTGLGSTTTIAVRAMAAPGSMALNYAEGLGFLVGGLASAAMIVYPGTRAAGWAGLASAFLANGLRQLENSLMKPTGGVGMVSFETQNAALGMVQANQLNGGFGLPMAVPQPHAYGTVPGVAGPQQDNGRPPINLLGPGSMGASSVTSMGGPSTMGLAASFGSTIFGGGR